MQSKLDNGIDYPSTDDSFVSVFPTNDSFDQLKHDIFQLKQQIEGKYGGRGAHVELKVQFTMNNDNDNSTQSQWTPPTLAELNSERHRLEMMYHLGIDHPIDDLESTCPSVDIYESKEEITKDILKLQQRIDMDYRYPSNFTLNVQFKPKSDMIVTFGDHSDDFLYHEIYDDNVNPCAQVPDYFGDDYQYHTNVFESSDALYEGPAYYPRASRDELVDAYQVLLAKFYYGPSHKDPCNPPYPISNDLRIADLIYKIIVTQMKIYDRYGVRVSHNLSRLDYDGDLEIIQLYNIFCNHYELFVSKRENIIKKIQKLDGTFDTLFFPPTPDSMNKLQMILQKLENNQVVNYENYRQGVDDVLIRKHYSKLASKYGGSVRGFNGAGVNSSDDSDSDEPEEYKRQDIIDKIWDYEKIGDQEVNYDLYPQNINECALILKKFQRGDDNEKEIKRLRSEIVFWDKKTKHDFHNMSVEAMRKLHVVTKRNFYLTKYENESDDGEPFYDNKYEEYDYNQSCTCHVSLALGDAKYDHEYKLSKSFETNKRELFINLIKEHVTNEKEIPDDLSELFVSAQRYINEWNDESEKKYLVDELKKLFPTHATETYLSKSLNELRCSLAAHIKHRATRIKCAFSGAICRKYVEYQNVVNKYTKTHVRSTDYIDRRMTMDDKRFEYYGNYDQQLDDELQFYDDDVCEHATIYKQCDDYEAEIEEKVDLLNDANDNDDYHDYDIRRRGNVQSIPQGDGTYGQSGSGRSASPVFIVDTDDEGDSRVSQLAPIIEESSDEGDDTGELGDRSARPSAEPLEIVDTDDDEGEEERQIAIPNGRSDFIPHLDRIVEENADSNNETTTSSNESEDDDDLYYDQNGLHKEVSQNDSA